MWDLCLTPPPDTNADSCICPFDVDGFFRGMKLIGLTGGIASGKSTACDYIRQHSSVPIIDADEIGHRVFQKYNHSIAAMFPELSEDGRVRRERVAEIVFADGEMRRRLERFLHPLITRSIICRIFSLWITGHRAVLLDLPLLFELGLDWLMSNVLLIYCSPTIQLRRLRVRDGFNLEQASSRLSSQIPLAEKVHLSDVVIVNNGSLSDLYDQLDVFIADMEQTSFLVDTLLFCIVPLVLLLLVILRVGTCISTALGDM